MDKRREKQFMIKVVCVIAAFALWIYVANFENPSQTKRLRGVKVDIKNIESLKDYNLVMLPDSEQDFTVTLSLKGPYTEIAKVTAEDFRLEVDLNQYPPVKGEKNYPVELKSAPESIQVINRDTLTVKIKLDNFKSKDVPVKADIDIGTKDGFIKLDPIVSPKTVKVSGAAKYVDDVEYVQAKHTAKEAESDATLSLPLTAYNAANHIVSNVTIDPNTVDALIPVKKRKTVGINIRQTGKTMNGIRIVSMTPIPDKIDIYGDAKAIDAVDKINTDLIDVSKINSNIDDMQVNLESIKDVSWNGGNGTIKVKVVIEKLITKDIPKDLSKDVKILNQNGDFNYAYDPAKFTFQIQGWESRINSLSPDDFQCSIDLKDLKEGDNQVTLNVVPPSDVTYTTVPPAKIKVTVTKKTTPPTTTTTTGQ